MRFTLASALALATVAAAAPAGRKNVQLDERQLPSIPLDAVEGLTSFLPPIDLDAINKVSDVLDTLGLKEAACTLRDSDIKVATANAQGVAEVTVTGDCLLDGAAITLPVFTGGAGAKAKRDTEVDLGGVDLGVKAKRETAVDLGGIDLGVKAKRQLPTIPLDTVEGLTSFPPPIDVSAIDTIASTLESLGLKDAACTLRDSDIKVKAANAQGVASVTVTGACLLDGAAVTLPVLAGAPSVKAKRETDVDLGGVDLGV